MSNVNCDIHVLSWVVTSKPRIIYLVKTSYLNATLAYIHLIIPSVISGSDNVCFPCELCSQCQHTRGYRGCSMVSWWSPWFCCDQMIVIAVCGQMGIYWLLWPLSSICLTRIGHKPSVFISFITESIESGIDFWTIVSCVLTLH